MTYSLEVMSEDSGHGSGWSWIEILSFPRSATLGHGLTSSQRQAQFHNGLSTIKWENVQIPHVQLLAHGRHWTCSLLSTAWENCRYQLSRLLCIRMNRRCVNLCGQTQCLRIASLMRRTHEQGCPELLLLPVVLQHSESNCGAIALT